MKILSRLGIGKDPTAHHLDVKGTVNLDSTLTVAGVASFAGTVSVAGAGTFSSTFSVTGAATLGSITSALHTLQGAQAADYQVKIKNFHATTGSGLRVETVSATSTVQVQTWLANGVQVGTLDGTSAWTIGSISGATTSALTHKLVRAGAGLAVVIPAGTTSQTNPTILQPATGQDQESMRLSAGTTSGIKSYIQVKGNWNGAAALGGGIDFAVKDVIIASSDLNGKWILGNAGSSQVHEVRGVGLTLIRPNDNASQGSYLAFTNSSLATQAYMGLGANTGTGLVTGEYNNGLVFKSAAGLAFSGTNNRVDGKMDANGKWVLGSTGGTQAHEVRGASINLIRPSDAIYVTSILGFSNAAGTQQALVGLGANTGDGIVIGEYNNGLVFKSAVGLVFSGVNNRVDGKMDSTGAWTFGASGQTPTHTFNGVASFVNNLSLAPTASIEANAAVLNIATTSVTTSLNIGTSSAVQSINIGTGSGVTTINLGGAADTVNIAGTLTYVNTTNLEVSDKLVRLNRGGAVSTADDAGVEIEENSAVTAYTKTGNTRNSWDFKAPARTGVMRLTPASAAATTELISVSTINRVWTIPDFTDTFVGLISAQTLTNKSLSGINNIFTSIPNSATTATSTNTANAIVTRDVNGAFSAGSVDFTALTTSGAVTLGNSTSSLHTFQGSQANDYQVKIINNLNATAVGGLRVAIVNTNAGSVVQDWTVAGAPVGGVYGTGAWIFGAPGQTQAHTFNGNVTMAATSSLEAAASTLNIGTTAATTTINIGTGSTATTMNIGNSTDTLVINANMSGRGVLPIGSVIATMPHLTGAYVCSSTTVADINGFVQCNGQTIADATSPMNGAVIPNINNSVFLMGASTSGTSAGSNSKTLTTTELPSHAHNMAHSHSNTFVASGAFASSTHTHDMVHVHQFMYMQGTSTLDSAYALTSQSPYTSFFDGSASIASAAITEHYVASGSGATAAYLPLGLQGYPLFTAGAINSSSALVQNTGGPSATASPAITGSVTDFTGSTYAVGVGTAFDIRPLYISSRYIMRIR